jgi:glycerophosphoryl diester phosphodiesterase
MTFIQNILKGLYKLNSFTTKEKYQLGYYICSILYFLASYVSQYLSEKPCYDLVAIVIRTIHHFSLFFIYFGFLAPTTIIPYILVLTSITTIFWIILKNKCILTIIENYLCNHSKNREFRDLTYYLSKKFDRFISSIRIHLLIVMIITIILRTYVYYRSNRVEIQGHRGARGNRPENTLAAFDYVLENGITFLELDLHMTSDGVLVIYHDDKINDTICKEKSIGGYIKNITLNELKEYDCGTFRNPEFPEQVLSKQRIPTFVELITHIKKKYPFLNVHFNVEIKRAEIDSDEYIKLIAEKLVEIFEKYKLVNNSIIQSFDTKALQYVRGFNPRIKTSFLFENFNERNIEKLIDICIKYQFDIFSPNFEYLTKQIVDKFKNKKIQILPWTVNKIEDLTKMMEMGVYSIITDYPVMMKEYLAEN